MFKGNTDNGDVVVMPDGTAHVLSVSTAKKRRRCVCCSFITLQKLKEAETRAQAERLLAEQKRLEAKRMAAEAETERLRLEAESKRAQLELEKTRAKNQMAAQLRAKEALKSTITAPLPLTVNTPIDETPLVETWWFWTVVGSAAVGTAVLTGIAISFSQGPSLGDHNLSNADNP